MAALGVPLPQLAHPDRAALADVRWSRGILAWELVRVMSTAAAAIALGAAGAAGAGAIIGASAPSVVVRLRREASRRRTARAVTPLLRTMHAALVSGTSFVDALRRAADASGSAELALTLRVALDRWARGEVLDHALLAAGATQPPRVERTLRLLALVARERLPARRAAAYVGGLAERAALDDAVAAEARSRSAGARTQLLVLAPLVPGLAAYLYATVPALQATLDDPLITHALLPLAALLDLAGIIVARRIIDVLPE